jgi:hypothetical protein
MPAADAIVKAPSSTTDAAREALTAALRVAGPRRHVLLADFALRLARLGHVTEVSVTVAGGPEAAEAGRRVLAELAPPEAPEDAPGETALGGAVEARGGNRGSDALEPLPRRNRACPECGANLRQDGRQAKRRVFCSVRCRVRHHRAMLAHTRACEPLPFRPHSDGCLPGR